VPSGERSRRHRRCFPESGHSPLVRATRSCFENARSRSPDEAKRNPGTVSKGSAMFPGVGAFAPRPGYAELFPRSCGLVARMKRSAIRGGRCRRSRQCFPESGRLPLVRVRGVVSASARFRSPDAAKRNPGSDVEGVGNVSRSWGIRPSSGLRGVVSGNARSRSPDEAKRNPGGVSKESAMFPGVGAFAPRSGYVERFPEWVRSASVLRQLGCDSP